MHSRFARAAVTPMLAVMAAAAIAAVSPASSVRAQTLTEPNPPAKWSPPQTTAKTRPAAHEKSCSAYGAGFVNVPGTDTCIKVGGWVEIQSGTSGR
jgi:Porin subfamily